MALSTEFERALSDLAEVRDRLARVQRFEGYSAPAAVASGIVALIAGVLQARLIPLPAAVPALHLYLQVWLGCLGAGLALNYGAVALWMLRNPRPGAHSQFRTAALSIAPSVLLGGAVTAALVSHGLFTLLPGVWFAFYAIGLFASRGAIPNAALSVTVGFAVLAVGFLATPLEAVALAWWVMPLGFGFGQLAIGYLLSRERER
ncbi:MAG: hypothetical protein JO029_04330 [Candidatus Eremiobacteraeota bacterium]|nr:hypothetical protein [Candidatus Eremiobacteraeota bacterium]MBV8433492.1 hypothetical protein [Candidatus Eremiobacteraeota bacterium]MBV8654728.1 hypothetical protein [Candidatus Eremiobacteraeota bacterium]